jgi:hypothetical protein
MFLMFQVVVPIVSDLHILISILHYSTAGMISYRRGAAPAHILFRNHYK